MGRASWPAWFAEEYPEIPEFDASGHELGPGKVRISFVPCGSSCPATTDGRGHHMTRCRVIGCPAGDIRPAGCTGAYEDR